MPKAVPHLRELAESRTVRGTEGQMTATMILCVYMCGWMYVCKEAEEVGARSGRGGGDGGDRRRKGGAEDATQEEGNDVGLGVGTALIEAVGRI